jgi:hypothetical protein
MAHKQCAGGGAVHPTVLLQPMLCVPWSSTSLAALDGGGMHGGTLLLHIPSIRPNHMHSHMRHAYEGMPPPPPHKNTLNEHHTQPHPTTQEGVRCPPGLQALHCDELVVPPHHATQGGLQLILPHLGRPMTPGASQQRQQPIRQDKQGWCQGARCMVCYTECLLSCSVAAVSTLATINSSWCCRPHSAPRKQRPAADGGSAATDAA